MIVEELHRFIAERILDDIDLGFGEMIQILGGCVILWPLRKVLEAMGIRIQGVGERDDGAHDVAGVPAECRGNGSKCVQEGVRKVERPESRDVREAQVADEWDLAENRQ